MADESVLIFGEIHTGLLQHSAALSPALCAELLALVRGDRVRRFERPITHARSPHTLVGVDCALAVSRGRARVIGTVACQASITGGSLVQSATVARLADTGTGHRLPWAHYLARPGRLELIGKADAADLAKRFIAPAPERGTLDLGAISARALDAVQSSSRLDRLPPLRAARTRLRWAATVSGSEPPTVLRFRTDNAVLRSVLLNCPEGGVEAVTEFCSDLALHDWLLTTVLDVLQRSHIGAVAGRDVLRVLRPVFVHLRHLWMPAARGDGWAAALWKSLRRRPGLDRQWKASMGRIQDQIALIGIDLQEAATTGSDG